MARKRTSVSPKNTLPKVSLEHLVRLTDDTGLLQHARYTTPLRREGYTTDDNARALTVASRFFARYGTEESLRLINTYLAFLLHAQSANGTFKNFMNYDRTWVPDEPSGDAFGRAMWALGTLIACSPGPPYLAAARDAFDLSIGHVPKQYPRGLACSILGLSAYLARFLDAGRQKDMIRLAADKIVERLAANARPDWHWFENALTYDNGVVPHGLFVAFSILGDKKYLTAAVEASDFLVKDCFNGRCFSFVGCDGWYEKGKARASFDQQPTEAASMVMMLGAAARATGDGKYKSLQRKAFNWFLGENDIALPMYNPGTGGCCDGLGQLGVNENQGAESTVAFLLARLVMFDSIA